MKNKTSILLVSISLLITFAAKAEDSSDPISISPAIHNQSPFRTQYGSDDRQDIFEVTSPKIRELARSVGAFIYYKKIAPADSTHEFKLDLKSYGERYKMCKGVRYYEQPSAPFATAFLVAPNVVATAAHAVTNSKKEAMMEEVLCSETYFIFDYAYTSENQDLQKISNQAVYKCARVIEKKLVWMSEDYALIELDRPVKDRKPLKFSKNGLPKVGDQIFTLGYPHGLPQKFSGLASVRSVDVESSRFSSNSDLAAGNSGSPVFDAATNEVLGIHVSGEYDLN
ncbi:MAG: trypsin-like peptidase domain-containing protein, partial [Bdellovibrionales bacterium]|nr:trypsin-like peptidase domain-containing protein [Bdellovibrionales bacterium]